MDEQKINPDGVSNSENSLSTIAYRYLTYWKWFLLSVALALIGGYAYIKFKAPLYQVNASILIKDDKKGAGLSELSAFEDLGLLKSANNIDNEIEILKSRELIGRVVTELRLHLSYVVEHSFIDKETFENPPIYVRVIKGDSSIYGREGTLRLTPTSNTSFDITDSTGRKMGNYIFGKELTTQYGPLTVLALTDLKKQDLIGKQIKIVISPVQKLITYYRRQIKVDPASKTANVILLSLEDSNREKAKAILNCLIKQHNADAIADKNQVSRNTAKFISDRIEFITTELSDVEGAAAEFKTKHGLVDVESEAKLFLKTGSEGELEMLEASTQKALAVYMYDYILKNDDPGQLVPANLGLNDISVANMIVEYNKLVLERTKLLRNSSEKNPIVENLDVQLLGLRKSLRESLLNYKNSLDIKVRELERQESGITSRIATVPKYEREYRIIQRQQQIKETLYLYLLQKREETNIALAVTVANAKVIDRAYSDGEPVSPKKKVVYLVSFLLGLIFPVTFLYIRDLLDNKVHGKRDVDRIGVPFLGDIPETDARHKIVVSKGESSSAAEAFRLLRTNVDFVIKTGYGGCKTIFITSTLSKEGKSFVAMNLASSIVLSGKKVLLMGLDIRAPKILEYFDMQEKTGITNYLVNPDLTLEQLIIPVPGVPEFHLLPSGSIPPNPSELLMSERVAQMFADLKRKYDYIIVDTAPIGMVTDTLLISSFADMFIYVVRAYTLDKRLLSVPEGLYKEKRLPNMAVLINGTDKKKAYGYGYGYGYGGYGYGNDKPRPKWKRLLGLS